MIFKKEPCPHHWLPGPLRADEPCYLVTVAKMRKKRSRDEIISSTKSSMIEYMFRVPFSKYIDALVEKENQMFGNLDCAFVPSEYRRMVSESNLENTKKQIEEHFMNRGIKTASRMLRDKPFLWEHIEIVENSSMGWKIIFEEVKDGTTDALKQIYSQCGLRFVLPEGLRRYEWMKILDGFVDFTKRHAFISQIYSIGSLARGATVCKDADVLIVRNGCPQKCDIRRLINSYRFEKCIPTLGYGFIYHSIDLFCSDESDFNSLIERNDRLVSDRKLLYQK